MDGSLEQIRRQFSHSKKLTVEYQGNSIHPCEGMRLCSSSNQLAAFEFDLDTLSVSDAITYISKQVEVSDISVESSSIDEVVANLYHQYQI